MLTLDLSLPILVTVVDGVIGTTVLFANAQLVIRTSSGNDFCAHSFGDLNSTDTDTTCTGMHEHPLVWLQLSPELESGITSWPCNEQSSSLFERDTVRHFHELPEVSLGFFAVSTLSSAKYASFAGDEIAAFRDGRVFGDDTGHFDTGDIRVWSLDLVFTLNGEDVEEVEGGRVDVDEDFRGAGSDFGFGNIVGKSGGKLGGSNVFVQVEGPHVCDCCNKL